MSYDVIVIGAGASGLLAAISSCRCGKKTMIIEKNERAARKLMITGKGRCNVTNSSGINEFMNNIFPEPRFLYPAFKSFFSSDIINLLEEAGVDIVLERGGRYFPASGKAIDIVDALVTTAKKSGVKFMFSTNATEINLHNDSVYEVKIHNSQGDSSLRTEKVIICTGGKSYPLTGSTGDGYILAQKCGHTISPTLPALVPLIGKGHFFKGLNNLTLKNITLSLFIDGEKTRNEFGELQFTDYGLTGPVVLTLSRWAVIALHNNRAVKMSIDLKPAIAETQLDRRILNDIDINGKQKLKKLFKEWLPTQIIPVFLEIAKLDGEKLANQVSGDERRKIVTLMKNFTFDIVGHRDFNEAIVTSGGVSISEINQKTMESKLVKGLYFAGEVIDVDANTGGYNLQIAFSTGWLAGMK